MNTIATGIIPFIAFSLLLFVTQSKDIGVPAYNLKVMTSKSCIQGLPFIASFDFDVPAPKYSLTFAQFDKLSVEEQSKVYAEISGYSVPVIHIADSFFPISFQATDVNGLTIASTSRPSRFAYQKPAMNPEHLTSKDRVMVGSRRQFQQFVDIGNFTSILKVHHVKFQATWYMSEVVKQGVKSTLIPIEILHLTNEDQTLLYDFINQQEYKSRNRSWLKCELNYGAIRDKLSKQAKEQLVILGFLRAMIAANKLEFTPVHWLDDVPPHLIPLALTLRFEVALAEGKKELADELENRMDKQYPGLYWEIKRIKEGNGMLINILKKNYW